MKVAIITPVKNEEKNLPRLIESVKNQSLEPFAWVIINDNSTDNSRRIIEEKTSLDEWIYLINKKGSEKYKMEKNYGKVLKIGYKYLKKESSDDFNEIDYYMVLDADMKLSPKYIEKIANIMEKKRKIVIASGGIYYPKNNSLKQEKLFEDEPAGGATLYDGEFFRSIDGPYAEVCPDTCAKIKARVKGFKCKYLSDFDVKAIQSRTTGARRKSFKDAVTLGEQNYKLGKKLDLIVMKSINYCSKKSIPYALGFLFGFLIALINNCEQVKDKDILRYNESSFSVVIKKLSKFEG